MMTRGCYLFALQAHVQRDAKSGSKTYLYAQKGESIRGRLPWPPSLCASALAKGCTLAQPKHGEFVVSVGVCVSCHSPSASCAWLEYHLHMRSSWLPMWVAGCDHRY